MNMQQKTDYNTLITALIWATRASESKDPREVRAHAHLARFYLERDFVEHYPSLFQAVLDELADANV